MYTISVSIIFNFRLEVDMTARSFVFQPFAAQLISQFQHFSCTATGEHALFELSLSEVKSITQSSKHLLTRNEYRDKNYFIFIEHNRIYIKIQHN